MSVLTTAEEYSSHFQAPAPGEVDFPNEWLVSASAFDPFPGSSMFIAAVEVTGDCDPPRKLAATVWMSQMGVPDIYCVTTMR